MSRIGNQPIKLPENVTAEIKGSVVRVAGPLGELEMEIRPEIKAEINDGSVVLSVRHDTKQSGAFWGMTRSLIANMVEGVTEGYEKRLEMVGVGYRVKKESNGLSMTVGYSHPVNFESPEGIELDAEGDKIIIVKGIDKQLVGLTASQIRKIRKPEPYKGKGIRYEDEVVRRKPGKAGKVQ